MAKRRRADNTMAKRRKADNTMAKRKKKDKRINNDLQNNDLLPFLRDKDSQYFPMARMFLLEKKNEMSTGF
jgi:hypothetical protein